MKKWFGKASFTDNDMRQEIGRVLNSVAHVLSKAEYVFPGQACNRDTYAYVEPEGEYALTADGKYIINLCPLFFQSEPSSQIETLTHETSHHSTALTEDVCLDYEPVYVEDDLANWQGEGSIVGQVFGMEDRGQEMEVKVMLVKSKTVVMRQWSEEEDQEECREAAYSREICEQLAQEDPISAVRNAENFCFYIQDITDAQ